MLPNPDDKRGFAHEIFNIDAVMEYYVVANEATSERYTVEVFEMPKVTEISIAYTYPDYTGLKPVVQTGTGNIQALVGTQAEIKLTTNKAIQTATFTRRTDVKDGFLVSAAEKLNLTPEPCLLYTSPSPRDRTRSRMPSSA